MEERCKCLNGTITVVAAKRTKSSCMLLSAIDKGVNFSYADEAGTEYIESFETPYCCLCGGKKAKP